MLQNAYQCGGQFLGRFERHAGRQLCDVFGVAQLDPEMSGRGSNARIDRGGPQDVGLVNRGGTGGETERPTRRVCECRAQRLEAGQVGDIGGRDLAIGGAQLEIAWNGFDHGARADWRDEQAVR